MSEDSYNFIKEKFKNPTIEPDYSKPFVIQIDAPGNVGYQIFKAYHGAEYDAIG